MKAATVLCNRILSSPRPRRKYSSSKKPHKKKQNLPLGLLFEWDQRRLRPFSLPGQQRAFLLQPIRCQTTKLDFWKPNGWKRWITQWECYQITSRLHFQNALTKVKTFLYAVGKEAKDVLTSLNLSEAEFNDYCIVRRKFNAHFTWSVNIVLESETQHKKARTK